MSQRRWFRAPYHHRAAWAFGVCLLLLGCRREDNVVPDPVPEAPDLPVLTVNEPARGSFHPSSVRVSGEVVPGTGTINSLEVNDEAVSWTEQGAFDTTLSPAPGMLLIGTRVEDDIGERAVDGRAVQVGPVHVPGAVIEDAIGVQLGPEMLDDDAPDLDDMASITEAIIEDPSFEQAMVGTTIEGTLDVTVTGFWLDTADVDIIPQPDVMWFDTYLNGVDATFRTSIIGIGVNGSMNATRAVLQMDLEAHSDASGVKVEAVWVQAVMEGFSWEADWVPSWAEDLLEDTVRQMVEEGLEDEARSRTAELVGETLSGFASDIRFGDDDELLMQFAIGDVGVASEGLVLWMDAGVSADPPRLPLPPGAGSLDTPGAAPALPTATSNPIRVVADDDFVNQMMFAFWHSGALTGWEMNALELAAMTGEALPPPLGPVQLATLDVGLPPLLAPPAGDMDLDISIGELHIGLTREDDVEVGASLNVRAGADITFLSSGLSIQVDDRPAMMTVHAGMLAWPEALDPGDLASLFRLSAPNLLGRSSSLMPNFPAPVLPIGELADVDALDGLEWELDQPQFEMTQDGWLVLEGRMTPQ
jgi:hypothetical protein